MSNCCNNSSCISVFPIRFLQYLDKIGEELFFYLYLDAYVVCNRLRKEVRYLKKFVFWHVEGVTKCEQDDRWGAYVDCWCCEEGVTARTHGNLINCENVTFCCNFFPPGTSVQGFRVLLSLCAHAPSLGAGCTVPANIRAFTQICHLPSVRCGSCEM